MPWYQPGFITAMHPKLEFPIYACRHLIDVQMKLSVYFLLAEQKRVLYSSIPTHIFYWKLCPHVLWEGCWSNIYNYYPFQHLQEIECSLTIAFKIIIKITSQNVYGILFLCFLVFVFSTHSKVNSVMAEIILVFSHMPKYLLSTH